MDESKKDRSDGKSKGEAAMNFLYPRPKVFSNPDKDFTPEELAGILQKSDADLTDTDFLCIFQSPVCAGTYRECFYFVPVILKRLQARSPDDGIASMMDCFLNWVDCFAEQLKQDGRFDEIVSVVMDEARALSNRFEGESAEGSIFCEIFSGLNDGRSFDHAGDKLLQEMLDKPLCYDNAAWFFDLLEWFYANLYQSSELLRQLSTDDPFKERARDVLLAEIISRNDSELLSYWEKVLTRCGVL